MSGRLEKPSIQLSGVFRAVGLCGSEIEIASLKAKAILAMLCTSSNGSRSRQWLQARLWSDRGQKQASDSFRQALRGLKQALEGSGIVLEADRRTLRLDLQTIQVIETQGEEFLEGFDIRDPEFEDWLRQERAQRISSEPPQFLTAPPPSAEDPWTISFGDIRGGEFQWFEMLFQDAITRSLTETLNIDFADGAPITDRTLVVDLDTRGGSEGLSLRITARHPAAGRRLWTGSRTVNAAGSPPIEHPDMLGLISELTHTLQDYIRKSQASAFESADSLYSRALKAMFTLQQDRLLEADRLLTQAYDQTPRGLYLAWRAQVRTIQFVEQHRKDVQQLREEGGEFSDRALEDEPGNSMVLALCSNTSGHLMRDHERSFELGQIGLQVNPANSMAWWAQSSSYMYLGELEKSKFCAVQGRNLSMLSHHRFWWDLQLFAVDFMMGNLEEARRLCRTTRALNPNCRSASRYLIALNAHEEQFEAAAKMAAELQGAEDGFSIERLLKDRKYPASLLHRAPGLRLDKLNDLA